jgi:hypothetical protein
MELAKLYCGLENSFRSNHMVTLGLEYIMARAFRTEHRSKVSDDLFWLFIGEEVTSTFLLALKNNWAESSSPGPGHDSELLLRNSSASCAEQGFRGYSQSPTDQQMPSRLRPTSKLVGLHMLLQASASADTVDTHAGL